MTNLINQFDQSLEYDEDEEDYYEEEEAENVKEDDKQVFSLKDFNNKQIEQKKQIEEEYSHVQGFYFDALTNTKSTIVEQQKIAEEEFKRAQAIFGIGGNFLLSQVKDILMEVFAYIPLKDLKNLSLTCKRMNSLMQEKSIWKSAILKSAERFRVNEEQKIENLLAFKIGRRPFLYSDSKLLFPSFSLDLVREEEKKKKEFPWKRVAETFLPYENLLLKILFSWGSIFSNIKMAESFFVLAEYLFSLKFYIQALDVATAAEIFVGHMTVITKKKKAPEGVKPELRTEIHCLKNLCLTEMAVISEDVFLHEKAYSFLTPEDINLGYYGRMLHYCLGRSLYFQNKYRDSTHHLVISLSYSPLKIPDIPILLLLKEMWNSLPKDEIICKVCGKWLDARNWKNLVCGHVKQGRNFSKTFPHEKFILEGILIIKGLN